MGSIPGLKPSDLRDISLYELRCLASGAAKAAGAEELIAPPTDAEHDALVAKYLRS